MKTWSYADSSSSRHGLMICSACGEDITGAYRYREGKNGFITQHRFCSSDDAAWAKLDKQRESMQSREKQRLAAYIKFRDKWGTTALDEEIDEMLERQRAGVKVQTAKVVKSSSCSECGSSRLSYLYECANGHVYRCKECSAEVQL